MCGQSKPKQKMALPREIMLIVNDISSQESHLLEWEVFGNAAEDMRVVLTWRKLVDIKSTINKRPPFGKWKLRQSSINEEETDQESPTDMEDLPMAQNKDGESWESKQKGNSFNTQNPYSEREFKDGFGLENSNLNGCNDANPFQRAEESNSETSYPYSPQKEDSSNDESTTKPSIRQDECQEFQGRSNDGDVNGKQHSDNTVTKFEVGNDSKEGSNKKRKHNQEPNSCADTGELDIDENKRKKQIVSNGGDNMESEESVDGEKNRQLEETQNHCNSKNGIDEDGDSDGSKNNKNNRQLYDEGEYKGVSKDGADGGLDIEESKNRQPCEEKDLDDNADLVGNAAIDKDRVVLEKEYPEAAMDDEEAASSITEKASKKKNPFRKLKKNELMKMKRNKLQLSFSIDQENEDVERQGDDDDDDESRQDDEGYFATRGIRSEDGGHKIDGTKVEVLKEKSAAQDQEDLKQLDVKIDPETMREFDPSRRTRFEEDATTIGCDGDADSPVELEKALEEISVDDITGKLQAKKILEMQRQRFEETPGDSVSPADAIDVRDNAVERKHSLGARELRESNMISLSHVGSYGYDGDDPVKKNLSLPKLTMQTTDEEEEYVVVNRHEGVDRLAPSTMHSDSVTGSVSERGRIFASRESEEWERCIDCKYNSFCDDPVHKSEYMAILLNDRANDNNETEACNCNVCNGGAVHNGCVYRELLRLKTEYRLFDKRNLCLCSVCVPFKYRVICLRQELRNLRRREGIDLYHRLTYHGDDGKEGYHQNLSELYDDSGEELDEGMEAVDPYGANFKNVLCLDNVTVELSTQDKIDFRNCLDCSFNGFCDDLRHKKLYRLLLLLDVEEFENLEDDCACLVCEFKGAAHSGCARRELIRLKYDFLLYDKRNLCCCPQCVPFKYRNMCLRQELKLLRRRKNIDLYCNL